MDVDIENVQNLLHELLQRVGEKSEADELCKRHGVKREHLNELGAFLARGADSRTKKPNAAPKPARENTHSSTARDTVVRARDVKRVYRMGREEVHALRGVNLEIYRGEYMSLMGPSGSGKTTLFNMLGALDKPSSGQVYIDEVDVAQLTAAELAWLRCRKIGYIFQTFNIIPVMTALENVTLPMVFADVHPDVARERGVKLLDRVGLGKRIHHKPFELSGGQQQRVAIARSLANEPSIILADEPTGNLDLKTGEEIIRLLRELCTENGTTIITATHDMKMLAISDRIVWIRDGLVDRIELRSELRIDVGGVSEH